MKLFSLLRIGKRQWTAERKIAMSEKTLSDPIPEESLKISNGLGEHPRASYQGNSIDLTALGALATSAIMLFTCLTCNMGYYCLPFFPVVLGIVGLLSARYAVDQKRTRLFSWIGVGSGIVIVGLLALTFILYFGLIIALAVSGNFD